ncbi:MAG: hypothetical protein V1720_18270 [bacterium]
MEEFGAGILGQSKSVRTLNKIIFSKRIPHALLFNGNSGVGKHLVAVEFAKYLFQSHNLHISEQVLNKITYLSEPYIKYVMPLPRGKNENSDDSPLDKLDESQIKEINEEIYKKISNPYYKITVDKANNIKINSIRDIRKFISMNYSDIPWRFIIISDAHLMTEDSQNALLKSLEEPPEGIIFILLTSNKEKLLSTILSRCWHVDFEPLDFQTIIEILTDYFKLTKHDAERVALFAGGSTHTALELIENDIDELIEKTISLLRFSLVKWYESAFKEITYILKNYPAPVFVQMLKMVLLWFTDTIKNKIEFRDYYFKNQLDTIEKFNEKFKDADLSRIFTTVENLIEAINRNVNLNIIASNIIFELGTISQR